MTIREDFRSLVAILPGVPLRYWFVFLFRAWLALMLAHATYRGLKDDFDDAWGRISESHSPSRNDQPKSETPTEKGVAK
jgi:hypothetical protein